MSDDTSTSTDPAAGQEPPAADATAPPEGEAFDEARAKAKIAKQNQENRALRERLKAAEAAEKRLAEIDDANKSETDKLREQIASLTAERDTAVVAELRARVAQSKGVPAELLTGTTADELEASANALLAFRGTATAPPDLGAGQRGDATSDGGQLSDVSGMSPDEVIDALQRGKFRDALKPTR